MGKSRRLSQLLSRVDFLADNLLPSQKANGNYSKKERDLIRSYVLLVHAEIEAYFEDIAKNKIQKALSDWMTTRKKSSCLKAILAFSGNDLSYEKIPVSSSNNIAFRINKSVQHYLSLVDMNHGVKQKNIFDLLLPIGVEINDFDGTWLSIMDAFGSTRGSIAHSSQQVQNQIDRNTEKNRIDVQILPEIIRLDTLIQKLN